MRPFAFAATTLVAALFFCACEESVNPILESDRNYTLFGTLDMDRDTQYVRIERIRPLLDPGEPGPLPGVTFSSTDLETDSVVTWRDSLVTFSDGSFGHVFYAPLRIQSGHTYRLQVDDAAMSVPTWAETTVPELILPRVQPERVQGGVGGAIGSGTQQVIWENLDRDPFIVETWYRFLVAERTPFVDIEVPYEAGNSPLTPTSWQVNLDLRKDRLTLDTLVQVRDYPLMGVGLQVTVLDRNFMPPGGVFDPEILVQPGTFSNVQNGFGFVGSVARFSVEWILSEDAMARLNYRSLGDIFGKRAQDVLRGVIEASEQQPADHSRHPRPQ